MRSLGIAVLGMFAVALTAVAANEISVTYAFMVKKGYLQMQVGQSGQITMSGDSFDHRTTSVTTNPEPLVISVDVSEVGLAFFKNTSTNHIIYVGVTGESPFVKLLPLEIWQGRVATNALSHFCDVAYTAEYTNIVGGVTNAYPATTNITATLESILLEN